MDPTSALARLLSLPQNESGRLDRAHKRTRQPSNKGQAPAGRQASKTEKTAGVKLKVFGPNEVNHSPPEWIGQKTAELFVDNRNGFPKSITVQELRK